METNREAKHDNNGLWKLNKSLLSVSLQILVVQLSVTRYPGYLSARRTGFLSGLPKGFRGFVAIVSTSCTNIQLWSKTAYYTWVVVLLMNVADQ